MDWRWTRNGPEIFIRFLSIKNFRSISGPPSTQYRSISGVARRDVSLVCGDSALLSNPIWGQIFGSFLGTALKFLGTSSGTSSGTFSGASSGASSGTFSGAKLCAHLRFQLGHRPIFQLSLDMIWNLVSNDDLNGCSLRADMVQWHGEAIA